MIATIRYEYSDATPRYSSGYLWSALQKEIHNRSWPSSKRAFDLGCGNGATGNMLSKLGFDVSGVDISESGIAQAKKNFPHIRCEVGSAYDDLASTYGTFDLVVSLDVIAHCVDSRTFVKTFLSLIRPGGIGFLATPYHGYFKNLALAITGSMDHHFTTLYDGAVVKFFSIDTLGQLLREAGAKHVRFIRIGRIPPLAKSMAAIVERREDGLPPRR
jgi:2-polyprenyl-3-methyl-5-hydroxy-6-metoxy-1,4-benzoquinol methylase